MLNRDWNIQEISNGFILTFSNGQKEFCGTWAEVMERLAEASP